MTANDGSAVLRGAGATDVGRVRSNNQDQFMLRPEALLWVVADGMGGHRGGEVASDMACKEMARIYHERTIDSLVQAVSSANRVVHEAGLADPDLRGMGTTLVALAVVAPDDSEGSPGATSRDEVLAIANVGDSRAYRLSGGELSQLTEDHSLVADMVREGRLAPDEAETHPQKNILTRVLGVYDEIPVDIVTVTPHAGDRYLLCSDGLFNEVAESEIAAVLRRLDDPEEAADELVRLSLANGARDNTTVVIVDVIDTTGGGGTPGRLGAAAPSAMSGTGPVGGLGVDQPGPATQPIGVITAEPVTTASPAPAAASAPATDLAERTLDMSDDAEASGGGPEGRMSRRAKRKQAKRNGGGAEPKPRRFTWRVALFLLVLVGLFGGVVATIQWWAKAVYYVGFDEDQVAIYHGRPGGVLWIDPDVVDESPLERADIEQYAPEHHDSIEEGVEHSSEAEAAEFVETLTDRATFYLVRLSGDRVAVSLNRPGSDPDVVEQSSLARDDLSEDEQDDLANGRSFDSQEDAEAYVDRLETAVEDRRAEEDEDEDEASEGADDTAAPPPPAEENAATEPADGGLESNDP